MYNGAVLRSVTTHTAKTGSMWQLKVRSHLESGLESSEINGILAIALKVEGGQTLKRWQSFNATTRSDGTTEVDVDISISEVSTNLVLEKNIRVL